MFSCQYIDFFKNYLGFFNVATTQWGRGTHVKNVQKFFLKVTPLGVKTCGESKFDIFKAKNAFLIQGKLVY
jgi:hypothetical protein